MWTAWLAGHSVGSFCRSVRSGTLRRRSAILRSHTDVILRSHTDDILRSHTDAILRSHTDVILRSHTDVILRSHTDVILRSHTDVILRSHTDVVLVPLHSLDLDSVGLVPNRHRAVLGTSGQLLLDPLADLRRNGVNAG